MYDEFISLMGQIAAGPGRDVADKIEGDGVTVSTVLTQDCGWETAIIDAKDVYPVERYDGEVDALEGHKRWGEWAQKIPEGARITKLGYGSVIEDEEIIIVKEGEW